jgi:hypothetical protein
MTTSAELASMAGVYRTKFASFRDGRELPAGSILLICNVRTVNGFHRADVVYPNGSVKNIQVVLTSFMYEKIG